MDEKLRVMYGAMLQNSYEDSECLDALMYFEHLLSKWHERVSKSIVNYHAGLQDAYAKDPSWNGYYDWVAGVHSRLYGGS